MLCVLAAVICNASIEASGKQAIAASRKKSALKSYSKFLSQGKIEWGSNKYKRSSFGFKTRDLDGDKIPELLLTCSEACSGDGYERIYTYKNGAVCEILGAGHGVFKFYPVKHIVCFSGAQSGDYWTRWYKMSNGKMKRVAAEEGVITYQAEPVYYYIKEKKVSKTNYKKYIKKLKGKEFKVAYIKNTKQNRKKYLKSS